LSLWDWLTLLNMMISSSIHFPSSNISSIFFMANKTLLYICTTCNAAILDGHLGGCYNLAILYSAAINMGYVGISIGACLWFFWVLYTKAVCLDLFLIF
jgi:hypothetical protein